MLELVPETIRRCLEMLQNDYRNTMGENLRGVYVHGSIAMGCFNPQSSDIDVLVVVEKPLSREMKKQLGAIHIKLSDQCPSNIELSVVLRSAVENFIYPTPFEFHYSDDHKNNFLNGTIDLITPRTDPDLAVHFVITRQYGLTLAGEPAHAIFPEVPAQYYLQAIAADAEWSYHNIVAGPDYGECRVPMYGVLNFCRVLAYIEEGLITSKRTGAEWALKNCAQEYHALIQEALNEYTLTGSSKPVDCATLKEFAQFVYEEKIKPFV